MRQNFNHLGQSKWYNLFAPNLHGNLLLCLGSLSCYITPSYLKVMNKLTDNFMQNI